jgi:hypothetical protein
MRCIHEYEKGSIMISRWLMRPKHSAFTLLGILMVLLLSACGGKTNAAPAPTATGAASASVVLSPQPSGTAKLAWNPTNKELTVNIALVGLAPNSTHPISISAGSCAAPGGAVYQLKPVKADQYGNALTVQTVMDVAGGIPAKAWYIAVHNGPTLGPAEGATTIGCANIMNPNAKPAAMQQVQASITGMPSMAGAPLPGGTATLSVVNGTLTVKVIVHGLAPNSMHAAHIHTGTCAKQGAIVHNLTTIKADATGAATVTTTIKNVTSIPTTGWFINIHEGPELTTQTGAAPILCGNVTTR